MAEAPGVAEKDILPTPKTEEERALYISIQNYFDQNNNIVDFLHRRPISTKTANYTIEGSDYLTLYDTTSGAITALLPVAAKHKGQEFLIKKTTGANTLTLDGDGSETIDLSTTQTVTGLMAVMSDGSNWQITRRYD